VFLLKFALPARAQETNVHFCHEKIENRPFSGQQRMEAVPEAQIEACRWFVGGDALLAEARGVGVAA
jgi:hypothetical protein